MTDFFSTNFWEHPHKRFFWASNFSKNNQHFYLNMLAEVDWQWVRVVGVWVARCRDNCANSITIGLPALGFATSNT